MMGVTFHGPPPDISEDKIVPFNVLQSLSLDVFTDHDSGHPELPSSVTSELGLWRSSRPAIGGGAATWVDVVTKWKAPEIVTPPVVVTGDSDAGITEHGVIDLTMQLWSDAFAWSYGVDVEGNRLNNDLSNKTGTELPLTWRDFDELYMAPPFVGTSA